MASFGRYLGRAVGRVINNALQDAVKELPRGTAPGLQREDSSYREEQNTPVTQEEARRQQPEEQKREDDKERSDINKASKDIFKALFSGEDSGGSGSGSGGGGGARAKTGSYEEYLLKDPKTGEETVNAGVSNDQRDLSNRDYGILSAMSTGMTRQEAEKFYDSEMSGREADVAAFAEMAANPLTGDTVRPDREQIADALLKDTRAAIFENVPGLDDWRVGTVDNPLAASARAQQGAQSRAQGENQGAAGGLQEFGRNWEDTVLDTQADVQQGLFGGQPDFADSLSRGDIGSLLTRDVGGTITGLPFGMASIPGTALAALGDTSKGYTLESDRNYRGERTGDFDVQDRTGEEQLAANVASALDVGGVAFGGGTAVKALRGAGRNARKVASDTVENALVEGTTEGLQGQLEATANREEYTPEQALNSILGGAIGGGVFGGVGSAAGQYAAARRAETASTGAGIDIVAPVDDIDAAGAIPMQYTPTMATSIDQDIQTAAARMAEPPIPGGPLSNQATPLPGQMPLEAPVVQSEDIVTPQTSLDSQIQQTQAPIDPMMTPEAQTMAQPMAQPMAQEAAVAPMTAEVAQPGANPAVAAQSQTVTQPVTEQVPNATQQVANTRASAIETFQRNPSITNTNRAASAILEDLSAARDVGATNEASTMVTELQDVLENLASRQARRNELVRDGALEQDEAVAELVDRWSAALAEDPSIADGWESISRGLASDTNLSTDAVLAALNEEMGGSPVAAQAQEATAQETAASPVQETATEAPQAEATQTAQPEEAATTATPAAEETATETATTEEATKPTKKRQPKKRAERQAPKRRAPERTTRDQLTREQRDSDSVIAAMDDLANNQLLNSDGRAEAMRSALTLDTVESRVEEAIGSSLTDAQRALVSDIYTRTDADIPAMMNAQLETRIENGKMKTTDPEVAYFLGFFDEAVSGEFSEDQLVSVVRTGNTLRYMDSQDVQLESGEVYSNQYAMSPRVEAMLMTLERSTPIFIAKEGVMDPATGGVTYSDSATGETSIVLNGDWVLQGGERYIEGSALDTTVHEKAHAFIRTLDVYDSPRAQALRERLSEIVPESDYFAQAREVVEARYPDIEVGSMMYNEEVMAFAVGDYVERLGRGENVTLPARFKAWFDEFVRFIKDTFHLQRYSVSQILDMEPAQVISSVARSSVEGTFSEINTPDALLSLSDIQLASLDTQTVIEAAANGDPEASAAIRNSIDLAETYFPEPPSSPFESIDASSVKRPSAITRDGTITYDSNGRPVPPGKIPETNAEFERLVDNVPVWGQWFEETAQWNRDSITEINVDEAVLRYEEQPITSEFVGGAGPYSPASKRLAAVYLYWKQRLYDPYAPATAVENAIQREARQKAKRELKGVPRRKMTPEERRKARRETEQWAARYRVAEAKVLAQRATDRMTGFSRRIGLADLRRWLENNETRQTQAKDYLDAKEIIGARDHLYEDSAAFKEEATARGFDSVGELFSWAEMTARDSALPESRKRQMDKIVKEVGNYVVDQALEAGEIDANYARNLKALNEVGSYWIMKLDDETIQDTQDTLMRGDVNALLNTSDNSLIKNKAEQFRTGSAHPITALYGGIQISTYRTDTARRNEAAVDALLEAGLAQEFNLNAYESGAAALPPRSQTNLSVKQYERLKEVYTEMFKEGYQYERSGDQSFAYLEVLENGERRAYAVPRDLYDAFADMAFKEGDNTTMNALSRFMRGFSTIVRTLTTTANVSLQVVLFVRDVLAVAMTGPSANVSGMNTLKFLGKGVYSAFADNAMLSEMGIAGDAFSRVAVRTQENSVRKAFAMSEMNPGKAKAAGNMFITYLEHGLNFSETVARAMLYHQSMQAYLDVGYSEDVASRMAVTKAAQGIGNFRESGAWVSRVGPFIAYANAALQGSRGSFRMLTDQPVQNAVRIMGTFALLGTASALMVSALGYDDDDWEEALKALPDSQRHRGIPMPKPGEPPRVNYETNKIEGVWMFPMPEFVYPLLNVLNNPNHETRTAKQAVFDNLTLLAMSITGLDAHGDDWDEMAMSLANQWLPNAVKPFIETQMSKNLFTGYDFFRDGALENVKAGVSTRNQLEVTGYSDTEHQIADFFTGLGLDMSAADVDTWARSLGSMASNIADEKPLWSFGSTWEPWASKKAISPYRQDDIYASLVAKWNQGETRLSETEKINAREDLNRSFGEATNLLNELRGESKTPEELRAIIDPEGGGGGAPDDRTLVLTAVGIRAEKEGWTKEQAAEEAAKYWNAKEDEIYDDTKYTREDVANYFDYLALAGEAFNSPRLKAQAEFAKSDRFWAAGTTAEQQASQMSELRKNYRAVNDVNLKLARTLAESENPDIAVETRKATDDLSDKLRIIYDRYEETFDPDLWYSRDEMKDFLKADLSDVSDEQWNTHSLKYYEALYQADGAVYAEGRDDLTSTSSSGYLYTSAKINNEYGVSKYIQECYGDGRSEMNITLTAWRELAETDPELYDLLYSYDSLRTEAGVSRKNGKHGERKYYEKSGGGGRGGSRRGGGGGGGGAGTFHIPTVADLSMKTFNPKGRTTTTSTSVKTPSTAPVTPTSVARLPYAGSGIKTTPTNFSGAKTVKYQKSPTRQPAMGEPYMSYLEGRSTQDSFKAARRYI